MAQGFQQIIIRGNLGRDPEMRYTPSGKAVTNLNVCVNSGFGDKQRTEWFRVVVWEKPAEASNEFLRKGSHVQVVGEIQTRKYTDKDGVEKTSTEVIARDVQFLDPAPARDDRDDRPARRDDRDDRRPARDDRDDRDDRRPAQRHLEPDDLDEPAPRRDNANASRYRDRR